MIKLLLARWCLRIAMLSASIIGLWFLLYEVSVLIDRNIGAVSGSPIFKGGLDVPFQHIPDPRQVLGFKGFSGDLLPSGSEILAVAGIIAAYWVSIHAWLYFTAPKRSKYR